MALDRRRRETAEKGLATNPTGISLLPGVKTLKMARHYLKSGEMRGRVVIPAEYGNKDAAPVIFG
jgi:hypothetical protein